MKLFDTAMDTISQGGVRRGAFAAYLDIDHSDIKEFLDIKNIGNPIQNLFFGVCVPDYWMQEMIDGDMEKREIWAKVLESRQQKGLPYIFFTDNVNRFKPDVYIDKKMTIHASNLCSEIALPSNSEESFVCCLSSMNLELYDEWKDTDAVQMAIFFLDAVMQEFIVKTEGNHYLASANRFAKRHRALGLGVMGWHSYLQKNMIPFESMEAKQLTNEIFKLMQKKSMEASKALANIYGEPDVLKDYGRRNTTLLAIAPTTSSSAILGQTSPGIEPFSSNYYKAGLSKGNFMRKNKYLKELLAEKNMDTEETWRSVMLNQGSVQHLDGLTESEKAIFKTFKETSQLEIIQQASIRQKYIDQAQSLNLNIPHNLAVRDVNQLLIEAWKLGVKTLYYQRSQSVSKEFVSNIVSCTSCEA
jgi:ribonucleoside-diphosphate reductase alpha chain